MINDGVVTPAIIEILFNGEMVNEVVFNGDVLSSTVSSRFYDKSARWISRNRGISGIRKEYQYLLDVMNGNADPFMILKVFAEEILKYDQAQVQFDRTKIKQWSRVFQKMGQDIPVCAFLAGAVTEKKINPQNIGSFDWPAIIASDDEQLKSILNGGLAENHYHLEASTQIFPLTWACMMNYPIEACEELRRRNVNDTSFYRIHDKYIQSIKYDRWIKSLDQGLINQFYENVPAGKVSNVITEELCWTVKNASILRALLFLRITEPEADIRLQLDKYRAHPYSLGNWSFIEALRRNIEPVINAGNGEIEAHETVAVENRYKLKQLDYTITNKLYQVDPTSPNRLLSGERNFLFQCFLNIYSGKWGKLEKDLLYTYIIDKINIRNRYVQMNSRMGFDNFQEIQKRKSELVYAKKEVYVKENYRLSIESAFRDYDVISLEARIMAQESLEELVKRIRTIDSQVEKAKISTYEDIYSKLVTGSHHFTEAEGDREKKAEPKYFYTVHIARRADSVTKISDSLYPRNYKNRVSAANVVQCLDNYYHER